MHNDPDRTQTTALCAALFSRLAARQRAFFSAFHWGFSRRNRRSLRRLFSRLLAMQVIQKNGHRVCRWPVYREENVQESSATSRLREHHHTHGAQCQCCESGSFPTAIISCMSHIAMTLTMVRRPY